MHEPRPLRLLGPDHPCASILRVWDWQAVSQPGAMLPHEPNTEAEFGSGRILWLSPCEWLFLECDTSEVRLALQAEIPAELLQLTDVSGSLSRFRLSGDNARRLLAKICSLDLHPRCFMPGRCVQTRLADVYVILRLVEDIFEILVETPLTRHLDLWLSEAGAEYCIAKES